MKKISQGFMLLCLLVGMTACSQKQAKNESATEDEQLTVVATFYPVYEFAKKIVGEEGEVQLLIPAGSEPHDFEPSAKEIANIHDADVFIYHNENMETWVPKAQKSWQTGAPHVIEGTKGIVLLPGNEEEHDHGTEEHHHELDPHTWISPKMAIKEVQAIKEQLMDLYPEKATVFESNAESYLGELQALDDAYTQGLVDAQQKSFVTQHAAFGYLALDYGLTQVPIVGLTPEEEPSAGRLAELKKYITENEIRYIYFEKNANDKIARTLADETNVQLEVLNPLESLTEAQMAAGETYLSVMKQNLEALQKTTRTAGKEIQPEQTEEPEKTVAQGYFSDEAVKERSLSDYAGEWQSVYPLLQAGQLDQVFEYKAKLNGDKSAAEYKDYYTEGYQTTIDSMTITGTTIEFSSQGKKQRFTYQPAGYQILTYEKGNRGVRFLFETTDEQAGQFKYVQFSDHNIAPTKAAHFHIYLGGESQEKLLTELHNWPTFYPANLSPHDIAQEMLAH